MGLWKINVFLAKRGFCFKIRFVKKSKFLAINIAMNAMVPALTIAYLAKTIFFFYKRIVINSIVRRDIIKILLRENAIFVTIVVKDAIQNVLVN